MRLTDSDYRLYTVIEPLPIPMLDIIRSLCEVHVLCFVCVKNTSFTTDPSITDPILVANIGTIRDTLPYPLHITS